MQRGSQIRDRLSVHSGEKKLQEMSNKTNFQRCKDGREKYEINCLIQLEPLDQQFLAKRGRLSHNACRANGHVQTTHLMSIHLDQFVGKLQSLAGSNIYPPFRLLSVPHRVLLFFLF